MKKTIMKYEDMKLKVNSRSVVHTAFKNFFKDFGIGRILIEVIREIFDRYDIEILGILCGLETAYIIISKAGIL